MIFEIGTSIIATVYRIRKNIGEELDLANWRIKIESPIFYLANTFCTHLTQNLARDPSACSALSGSDSSLAITLKYLASICMSSAFNTFEQ